ncbi:FkbM family methyltransferase [Flagellimonas marinaquae]
MKRFLRSLIYMSTVNRFIRNLTLPFKSLIPDRYKISPSGLVRIRVNRELSINIKTNQTSYITKQLFWLDPLCFEYTPIFLDIIKDMNTFWDVGANIGYYSIIGSKTNPTLTVEAFEPSMGPMTYLSENIKINNVSKRVKINPYALSDDTGDIDFYEIYNPKFPSILNLSGEHNTGAKNKILSKKTKVAAKCLDDVRRDSNQIDLIKIDVEGSEIQVLKGGIETIKDDRPIIICEVLFGLNESDLDLMFQNMNYTYFAHVGNGLKRIDSLLRKHDNGVRNVFFIPKEKETIVEKYIIN